MTRFVVVTGTDTGVGKTHVTTQLIRALAGQAIGLKPVETGWDEPASDAARLAVASGRPIKHTVYRHFELAASPKMAAEHDQLRPLELDRLVTWVRKESMGSTICLVEGAGGWRVPWGESLELAHLAGALDAGVLIVGRAGLGTINHSLLTIEAVRRSRPVLAVVLSVRPADDEAFAIGNALEIQRVAQVPTFLFPHNATALVGLFHVEQPETPPSS